MSGPRVISRRWNAEGAATVRRTVRHEALASGGTLFSTVRHEALMARETAASYGTLFSVTFSRPLWDRPITLATRTLVAAQTGADAFMAGAKLSSAMFAASEQDRMAREAVR